MTYYVRYCMVLSFFAAIGVGGLTGLTGCQEADKDDSASARQDRTVVLDCIVEYYSPDGSRYVSEQSHKINFDKKILRISANEPTGKFEWLLKNGIFTTLQSPTVSATPSITLCNENIAKGLLGLYIANVNNMGLSLTNSPKPVKIQGQWYQKLTGSGNLTFCRNLDTSIIDTVLMAGIDKKNLMLRGYRYRKIETVAGSIPTEIEIFEVRDKGAELKPLVRYNSVVWEQSH